MLTRTATIVPERELVQIRLEMASFNPAVVGSAQPSFEVANDPMHPRQDFGGLRRLTLDSWAMPVSKRIQPFVPVPVIRVDLSARSNMLTNEAVQGLLGGILDKSQPDPAGVITPVLDCRNNKAFTGASSGLASTGATDVRLIGFDYPAEGVAKGVDHGPAQSPAQRKGRPVRPETDLVLQLQSRDPGGQGTHEMSCPEPVLQGKSRPMHGRASRDGYLGMAFLAVKKPPPNGPSRPVSTAGTLKPIWPTNAHQILDTSLICGESLLKFCEGSRESWIVGSHEIVYPANSLESSA